jgi:predicted SAM-dependent methyltransferase
MPSRGFATSIVLMLREYATRIRSEAQKASRLRALAKELLTSVLVPVEMNRAVSLARARDGLRLHLGCADNYLPGWINVDLARPGRRLDLRWDVRRGLPFPDGICRAIFAEHLLEHLDVLEGITLIGECLRVLWPAGILRIGVPDLARYVSSYECGDFLRERDGGRLGSPTRALALGEIFFMHGHRSMYDGETLALMCLEAGFEGAQTFEFGLGSLQPSPDSAHRRGETLYLEAQKGGAIGLPRKGSHGVSG